MSGVSTTLTQYSTVLLPPVRRNAQDAPLLDLLSYRSSVSPTITITKTLFSAGLVTSTRGEAPTSGRLIDLTSGLPASSQSLQGTITDTSTLFHTNTVTSTTHQNTPLIDLSLLPTPQTVTSSQSTSSSSSSITSQAQVDGSNHAGTAAGVTVGIFSAIGLIGYLLWYLLLRRGRNWPRFRLSLNFNRRKNDMWTPQMEDQKMQEARNVMLAEAIRKTRGRTRSETGSDRRHSRTYDTRSSVIIGMAVTDDVLTAPPLIPAGFRDSDTPGTGSVLPIDLPPGTAPAPITTSGPPQIGNPEHVSPLSPRGMYNAAAAGAGRAWKRASQVLSPGPNVAAQSVGRDGFEFLGDDGRLKDHRAGAIRETPRALPGTPGLWF